nr:MAG TPA: 43 kDa tail protein [Caudoviricetes sp.]
MSIKLVCIKTDKSQFDITQPVKTITWSGNFKACSRKLEFKMLDVGIDIPLSSYILLYENEVELFRGFVYEREKSSDGIFSFICFDHGEKLNKIKVAYNIKNQTADEIMSMILKDVGFGIGSIAKASVKVNKVFIGVSIYDTLMTAYTYQHKEDSKSYMIYSKAGKICSSEKGIVKLKVSFEEGKNIENSTFKESVTSMINRVLIVDDKGNKVSEVRDQEMLNIHGLFQDVYKTEEGKDANVEAKAMLKGVEQTCTLSGFGDTTCQTGYGVEIKDGTTGLVGLFYIDSDTHTWENGEYKIDLDLNFKNIMNEVQAGEDEAKEDSVTGGGDSTMVGGKTVKAEFTAYYPENSAMQGGFYDAMGNRLDPSKLTCACPKEVPFKTKIQVQGTSSDRDGLIYTCTDRGGAIKIVNGVYKIDLLMANRKEAYAFGRRKGTAIIGGEVISSSSGGSSSSKGAKIIEIAKTKLGCKYVWGATGPNTFDCSGLTQWCHKQVGISIPRTSGQQRGSGKKISKANAQLGDIVCFEGHVGLYAGNGQMIHAPNSQKPVKYDNCFSGYWGSRVIDIRRYW